MEQREIVKARPEDAGCYVDGHWGQFATAHMIERAIEFGFTDPELEDIAARHIASIGPSFAIGITDDEHEFLSSDGSDKAENWLNENAAPDGFSFGWWEGEFFLWTTEQWENPFDL